MMIPVHESRSRAFIETSMLIERHAASWMQAKYRAGLLSEELFREMARDVLFAPFHGLKLRGRLRPARHPHAPGCAGHPVHVHYETEQLPFGAQPETFLVDTELLVLAKIERCRSALDGLAPSGIEILGHTGTCSACHSKQTALGVLVTVHVAGLELSREYALGGF